MQKNASVYPIFDLNAEWKKVYKDTVKSVVFLKTRTAPMFITAIWKYAQYNDAY